MVVLNDLVSLELQSVISILAFFLVLLNFESKVSCLLFQPTYLPLICIYLLRFLLIRLKQIVIFFRSILCIRYELTERAIELFIKLLNLSNEIMLH